MLWGSGVDSWKSMAEKTVIVETINGSRSYLYENWAIACFKRNCNGLHNGQRFLNYLKITLVLFIGYYAIRPDFISLPNRVPITKVFLLISF